MENYELHLENLPHSVELACEGGRIVFHYIDERLLPGELHMKATSDWRDVVDAVKALAVRGAPAIGLAGAAALALWAAEAGSRDGMHEAAEVIANARPTAVNLQWAVNRAMAEVAGLPFDEVPGALYALVKDMEAEDEARNRAIGEQGAALIEPGSRILTHCNAGSLATFYYGTALGIVYSAAAQGKVERVYADETRPVGQGARLTVWELARAGVPATLICDNMAASLMAKGEVDAVIVGADRIAANGDVANKIGTLGVAVLAKEFGVPFYVAAPTSTIDAALPNGEGIAIEQRAASEVLPRAIPGVDVWNPAFDVTPARYITRIVTENGAFTPQELAAGL